MSQGADEDLGATANSRLGADRGRRNTRPLLTAPRADTGTLPATRPRCLSDRRKFNHFFGHDRPVDLG